MPRAFIECPPLYPQIKPCILKNELPTIAPDRVSTVDDQYKTLIGGGRHKPEKAMGIARILAVHYEYLPDGFAKEVLGIDTADFAKYRQMQKAIMNELYGKSSFLYEYVRGEVSADACRTAISNWDLCARQCDFEVGGESEEQRANRIADRDRYRQAIVKLQNEIRDMYEAGIVDAKEVMTSETAKSIDKFVAGEKAIFFEQKRNEVPQSCFTNLGLISNVRELEMIKLIPLFFRKDSERDYFWQKRINGDLITTIFNLAKGMVDLRTLMSREDWARVWTEKLASTMDIMHRSVITLELVRDFHCIYSTDPMLRASFEVQLDRPSMNVAIRDLVKLVDKPADIGHWTNVPLTTDMRKHHMDDKDATPLPQ